MIDNPGASKPTAAPDNHIGKLTGRGGATLLHPAAAQASDGATVTTAASNARNTRISAPLRPVPGHTSKPAPKEAARRDSPNRPPPAAAPAPCPAST
ncbi:MAG: hypothetical protein NVS2B11_01760 [Acetobacteraceae bacterium]